MVKKILSITLATVLSIPTMLATLSLPVTAEEMPVYQASVYYVDSENTNPNSPWSWDYYDMEDEEYKKLEQLVTGTSTSRGYSIVSGYNAVTAIDADEMYGDWRGSTKNGATNNGTGTSEWVKPEGSSYAGAWQQYYPVRSFTAPRTGNVTITAADDAITYTGTATSASSKLSFRIMQDRDGELTKVWPVDADVDVYEAGPNNPISFSALDIVVMQGDILRFELYTPDEATNGSNFIRAKWDPIVSYNSFVSVKEFQPSETDNLPLEQVFTIITEFEMEPISESDVTITGTTQATVRDLQQSGDTISFAFDGLSYNGSYDVEIGGLKPSGSSEEGESYQFSFTTITSVYQASVYYVDNEYTNPKGPWSWDYYDMKTGKYNKLTALNSDKRGYSIVGGYDAVTAIDADEMYGDWRGSTKNGATNNGTGASEWVKPEGSEYAGAWQQYYPVRSFTAPKTGSVTITAADDAITYSGTATGTSSKLSFRIMQDRDGVLTKVWPVDADVYEAGPGNPISFSALDIVVLQGDVLRFELYTPDEATNGSNFIRAKWDPIVSYNSFVSVKDFQPSETDNLPLDQVFTITTESEMEPISESDVTITGTTQATVSYLEQIDNTISFAFDGLSYNGSYDVEVGGLKPLGSSEEGESYQFSFTTITLKKYQASDYYDEEGKKNPLTVDGESPWTWESYDLKTKTYTPLPKFNSSRGFAIVGNYNAVTAVDSSAMYGDTRQDGQGDYVSDETYTYAWQRYYPVRTFTVPESGGVTISAAGDTITAKSSTAPSLRILLERDGEFSQVWPENGWKAVNDSAPISFTPLKKNVIKGDKLHFELNAAEASTSSCWNMIAYWDPIVAYTGKHPTVTATSPENGAADVPGNTEFVVTFAEEICEPSVQNVEIDGDAAVDSVWLENGNEVHILLDSTTLKERTEYTLRLKDIRLKIWDEQSSFEHCISFTTATHTVLGEFSLSGTSVVLPVNNTLGSSSPVTMTIIAVLCKGTPENYTITGTTKYKTETITGNSNMSVELGSAPENDEFIKAVAVTAPGFGKLLMDMAILE